MTYKNLVKGQYQIGDIVMGHGTNIIVESFDAKPYDINAQDYQVSRSDEVRFGFDSLKPTTIEMNMVVIYNWLLDPYKNTRTNFWHSMPTVSDLSREWRGNNVRNQWGEMKPIYFCGRDGIGKMIYGRPGQFSVEKVAANSTMVKCVGEFRRADTLVHSAEESFVQITNNDVPQFLYRLYGDSDSWLRIIGIGPMTDPVITIGTNIIKLNIDLDEGEMFEISSYPWQRRAVDSDRNNLRNLLVDNSPYLDAMKIPCASWIPIRWTSAEQNTWVPYLGNADWNLDIEDTKKRNLPLSDWNFIHGRPVIRYDLINPTGPTHYLSGRYYRRTDAAIYTTQTYKTTSQCMQARIVQPYWGRSALVMMSNFTMTNFAALEVSSGPSNNKLIIRTGSAYNNLSVARATYTNPAPLGWRETDVVKFTYTPATKKFAAHLNDVEVASWIDSGNVVTANATTNKYSGFIFDIDGTLTSVGTGFKDISSWDNLMLPAEVTGAVYLGWRDSWSTID